MVVESQQTYPTILMMWAVCDRKKKHCPKSALVQLSFKALRALDGAGLQSHSDDAGLAMLRIACLYSIARAVYESMSIPPAMFSVGTVKSMTSVFSTCFFAAFESVS